MQALRMDGAKFMFRLDPADSASGRTILACADAVSQCVRADLTAFLEPLPVKRVRGKYVVQRTAEDLPRNRHGCTMPSSLSATRRAIS
jgi:hypothetical protein